MEPQIRHYLSAILALTLLFVPEVWAQNDTNEESAEVPAGLQYWNNIKGEAIETESGLQYKVLIMGRGRKPEAKNNVYVHYRGLLLDGREFDNSYANDEPLKFNLKRVIKGWTEGLQFMPSGSVFVFLIPPELAYGERGGGAGAIPSNATLIFEIELFKVK